MPTQSTDTVSRDLPFTQIPDWIILNPDISHACFRVYAAICRRVDKARTSFPSVATIARDAQCSTSTVTASINTLKSVGAIVVTRRYSDDGKTVLSNHYHLPLTKVVAMVDIPPRDDRDTPPRDSRDVTTPISLTTPNELQIAKRDAHWDTIVAILGQPSKSKASLQGKLVARLKEENVEPGEIRIRAERLATHWGAKALTLPALVEHWDWLGSPAAQVTPSQIKQTTRERELLQAMEGIE